VDNDRSTWSAPLAGAIAVAAGGVALAVVAALPATDAPGRLIVSVAALGLFAIATLALGRRPRLTLVRAGASAPRLGVRSLRAVEWYSPDDITQVRLTRTRRLGRATPMLEVDTRVRDQERLIVLSRWDLGAHPQDVYEALAASGLVGPDRRH
jgi:hypothetical protein